MNKDERNEILNSSQRSPCEVSESPLLDRRLVAGDLITCILYKDHYT